MQIVNQKEVFWYAVYTRPNQEKKVTDQLSKKGVVVYCPLQKVIRQWSDRKKVLEIPAFRGYVFVQIHVVVVLNHLFYKSLLAFNE